jgi:hypothetical protein
MTNATRIHKQNKDLAHLFGCFLNKNKSGYVHELYVAFQTDLWYLTFKNRASYI